MSFFREGRISSNPVFCAPVKHGGLILVHVKNCLHALRLKWMAQLCRDVGSSWSDFIWPKILNFSSFNLIGGIRNLQEADLNESTPFYQSMLHSYACVNNLFCEYNTDIDLPINIWQSNLFHWVDKIWCEVGLTTLSTLPLVNGRIVVDEVTSGLQHTKAASNAYLRCCAMQKFFGPCINLGQEGTHLVHPELEKWVKELLKTALIFSLTNWCKALQIVPLDDRQAKKIFSEHALPM